MSDLEHLARISKLRGDAEMRAADYFRTIPDDALINFASDVMSGEPLEGWLILGSGSVDELLRAFAYATLLRECHRRAEVDVLE